MTTRDEMFPVTRAVLGRLDVWVSALAAPFTPAVKVPIPGGFRWEFREQRAETLMVGKAVRMVSGVRAAWLLADAKYTAECGSLLRMVSDFAGEITSVAEGLLEGRMTEDQERFIRQYFAPLAGTPEEHERAERERYVSREALLKAHYRLAEKATGDANEVRRLTRYLNYAYDKFVHGAYITAMDLYNGLSHRFMLAGNESIRHQCLARTSVAGKLYEVVAALEMMALLWGEAEVLEDIRRYRRLMEKSPEQSSAYCR